MSDDTLTPQDLELLNRIAAAAVDPVEPPPAVRVRVLMAIPGLRQPDESVPGPDQSMTVRADQGSWKAIAPGARMKRLRKDASRMTVLLELEPYAVVDAHDHAEGEDSFVIRGSCRIGGLALNTGDFHHSDAGSHHGDVVASAEGCLLLLTFDQTAAA